MSSRSSTSRSKYSHFMIGSATSVLKDDFITAFENDEQFDVKPWLPKLKLPSQMDVLKLILFLRDEAGKNNHVEKIHQEYKRLLQNKNKTTPSFVKAREIFLMSETAKDEKTEKLFDIGHKDLEKSLSIEMQCIRNTWNYIQNPILSEIIVQFYFSPSAAARRNYFSD